MLVAMCEPSFGPTSPTTIPSDAELAERLGTTANVVSATYMKEVREALGFDKYEPSLRQTIVAVAIAQGLVTVDDLEVLDER
jgi:hypothetical protein